ncbi:MAG: ABC transporter permease [Pirellulales bacterium]
MSTSRTTWLDTAFVQLVIARVREFYREPEAVFWVYGFPLLMATALGIAFRNQPIEKLNVDVVAAAGESGAVADSSRWIAETLRGQERFVVREVSDVEGRRRIRSGKTDVLVIGGPEKAASYLFDFTRKESHLARNAVDDALQRAAGRVDVVHSENQSFDEPGGRYIDFLVPGLLGMSLMGGGLWGVGYVIVDMRIRKLLKRFLATPMRRSHFLAAVLTSRLLFLLPEVLVLLLFSRIAFGVQSQGSLLSVLLLILLGALAFAGIGLLVASRAKTLESVSGLMNLVMLPMWVLSGIFFSSDRFPEAVQPAIKLLPLTQVIDALRAVMLDGMPLTSQWQPILGLTLWATASFGLALRWFRWN